MEINKKMKQFVVIGLGRFGKAVAKTLSDLGNEVLVIDNNPEEVKQFEGIVSEAVVADATGTNVLFSLGIQNFDCVINCIGNDLQANILTTLICKELGVKYVVAKAQNEQNKKVLEKIGADLVIFPEVYLGRKIANILSNPSINEIASLTNNYKIVEIATPDNWQNKSLLDNNIRNKHNITVIFIKRKGVVIYPNADTKLLKGDILIVAGEDKILKKLSLKISDVLDTMDSFKDVMLF